MTASNRREIVEAVDAAIQLGASQASCCETLSLCERRLQRWRIEAEDKRIGGYRAKNQRMSAFEIEVAVVLIHKAEEARKPLRCAYAEQLDVGMYVCSPASLYRIRNRLVPVESRPPLMMKRRRRRELKAETVNSIWCWDITPMKLRIGGPVLLFLCLHGSLQPQAGGLDGRCSGRWPCRAGCVGRCDNALDVGSLSFDPSLR